MPTVYVLVGLQGAGKSTWAAAHAGRLAAVVVASDEIRNELEAAGIDAANEGDRVFALLEDRVARLLGEGRNVIVDATHARRRWRSNVLALARQRGARCVAVWFDLPFRTMAARNARKPGGGWGDRVVPNEVLRRIWRGFEPPGPEEFDEVWRLTLRNVSE